MLSSFDLLCKLAYLDFIPIYLLVKKTNLPI